MKTGDDSTINKLLEAFQECTSRGEQAKLFLETRNGMVYVNMAVNLSLPVLRPGNCSTLKKKKKTPSTLRRNQERMEMFLQRKKAAIPSTSTPKSQNAEAPRSASPASSSQAMETSNTAADTVGWETPGQDTGAWKQDGETTKGTTKRFSGEFWAKFDEMLDKHIAKSSTKIINNLPPENERNNDDIESDDGDNIEAAKEWTIRQKLSFRK